MFSLFKFSLQVYNFYISFYVHVIVHRDKSL